MPSNQPTSVTFSDGERAILSRCAGQFRETFYNRVFTPVSRVLNLVPAPVSRYLQSLEALEQDLGQSALRAYDLAVLKAALLHHLRTETARHEEREHRTPDPATKAALLAELQPLVDLANSSWALETEAAAPPVLSDFLVMSQIEEWFRNDNQRLPRTYDEKFGLLYAPRLFLPDLAYHRVQCCELRGRPISVGYIDIDDFKTFNTRLTEPRVDREVLPAFMRVLEAAVYIHGSAYRYGGDEYVVLLPNRAVRDAVTFFQRLRRDIASAHYGPSGVTPTVSIGITEVRADSPLTDRQVEEHAARAKDFAKHNGKDCVATYTTFPPRIGELTLCASDRDAL